MSSRERLRPKVIYKMQLSVLFRKTEEYHVNELKLLFQKYNPPVSSGEENKKWTSNMSESTLNKLRLFEYTFHGQWDLILLSGIVITLVNKLL